MKGEYFMTVEDIKQKSMQAKAYTTDCIPEMF